MITRDHENAPWKILSDTPGEPVNVDVDDESEVVPAPATKRPGSPITDSEPPAKRPRNSSSVCLAPPLNPTAQRILSSSSVDLGTGDIFLSENFRERWCRCPQCSKDLEAHPYLLEEEETYEPPEDPDSGKI